MTGPFSTTWGLNSPSTYLQMAGKVNLPLSRGCWCLGCYSSPGPLGMAEPVSSGLCFLQSSEWPPLHQGFDAVPLAWGAPPHPQGAMYRALWTGPLAYSVGLWQAASISLRVSLTSGGTVLLVCVPKYSLRLHCLSLNILDPTKGNHICFLFWHRNAKLGISFFFLSGRGGSLQKVLKRIMDRVHK